MMDQLFAVQSYYDSSSERVSVRRWIMALINKLYHILPNSRISLANDEIDEIFGFYPANYTVPETKLIVVS